MIIRRKICKIAAATLAALLLVADAVAFAAVPAAETAAEGTAVSDGASADELRFVLMMDVSRTMNQSDPKGYGRDAAQMFADMLPAGRAKVSLFSFGHDSGDAAYDFGEDLAPITPANGRYVQMLTGFDAASPREAVKEAVADLAWNGEQTPLDAAMLAGADVLKKDDEGGKACVILVTDGDYKSRFITDPSDPVRDIERAVDVLSANGWNAYCIELDYANSEGKREEANRFLTENISGKTGGKTWQVAKAEDVGKAYMEIIDSFLGTGKMTTVTAGDDAAAFITFEIPELSSETNITVNAEPLSRISLYRGTDAVPFEADWGNTWCNIGLSLPSPGTWRVEAQTTPGTEVAANIVSFSEISPEIRFLPEANAIEAPLSKTEKLTATAVLTSPAGIVKKESLGGVTAVLLLTGPDGKTKEVPMDFDEGTAAFTKTMTFAEAGRSGKWEVSAEIRTTDGRTLTAEPVTYTTKNRPVEKKADASIELTDHVRGKAAEIPAAALFADPDGEELSLKLSFEGPSVSLSEDGKTVSVLPGDVPGDYEGTLKVWDADMGETGAVQIPVHVTVQNHPMAAGRLSDVNMTAEYVKEKDIDVRGLFTDEDQPELTASLKEDFDGEVLDAALENGVLHLAAKTDGTTKITLFAVDDDGKEYTSTFTVKGATDASIRRQKLAILVGKLGAAGIVLAVLAVIAILVILLLRANSKIRGEWKITVTVPGQDPWKVIVDAGAELRGKERRSTNLYKFLDLDDRSSRNKVVAYLQENEHILKKIKLNGAFGVNGAKITVQPPVTLRINGSKPVTSAKYQTGEAELSVDREDAAMKIQIML